MAVRRCVASIDVVEAAEKRITNVFRNGLNQNLNYLILSTIIRCRRAFIKSSETVALSHFLFTFIEYTT